MSTTIIKNVKIFNGIECIEADKVVIENGYITDKAEGDIEIDGSGCTLLPGFIDAHIHLYESKNLKEASMYGVTTMMDMGTRSPEVVDSLKNLSGLPDIRSSYCPAFASGSNMPIKMGYSESAYVISATDAERFVNEQIANGADYIKVILEEQSVSVKTTTFPLEIVAAIVVQAHINGKKVIAHAVSTNSFKTAIKAGVDVVTHIPFVEPLTEEIIELMSKNGTVSVPTMVTMKGIVESIKKFNPYAPLNYDYVKESVAKLYKAGVTIMAGSDSNTGDPTTPYSAPYGISLLDELKLMVEAGFTPIQAIQSATSITAKYFGMDDRGIIKPGYRADLILIKGDPTVDINVVKDIKQVWIRGKETIK
ncbi:amidohydrolase family protein [Clostridium sp. 'White wine YQ']|uniref:amidohydrolase family protein n=1 Tax=Clostridium sp. 'White wine YQ' TaxID=3027474 RepID=UPI002365F1FC|nr:amidohydrolase family protein [Clostridium sp. 'White wine YQ']MDD7793482.1 amidohydrolase family protein [Clostridium sp. 'White wine YQ']